MIALDTHAWIWWLADRIIVATALSAGATLVTGDERLRAYRPVTTAR